MNRTKNSARNAGIAVISKILTIIITFISRTIFIKYLGEEYLGVNGLFTNILMILSFAELGIGNAIIFKLYKPIADNDKEKIKTLVYFYKKAYFLIGLIIFFLGLLIIPFLGVMINNAPDIKESITFIYILFLINTTISYFFTYKKSVISGFQKEYIINIVTLITTFIQNIIQIIILVVSQNYILYLITLIASTIMNNVINSYIADKLYPYINEKEYSKLDKKEQKNIFNDVKSLIIYKLGYVLSNGTDNIIISSFLGVGQVGLLSNYTTITSAITSLLSTPFNSLTASIGNLNTIKDNDRKESVFYQILFISFIIYGYVSIATGILLNRFITIWLGIDYALAFSISIAIAFNLYIDGMRFVNYTFRNTLGLFKKGRFLPLLSSISNVILSIILVKYAGMFGVLIATGVTRLLIMTWYDPYLIHKNAFKTSSTRYYKTYIYYLVVSIITFILCTKIDRTISITGILGFIISGMVVSVIIFILFLLCTFKLKEFKETKERIAGLIKKSKE